ncbi:YMGG-like glycine zipper-containing protein [Roseococcus thiosulfatophilus]|uniref:YMGG-like glycine zipper-containing protein n=1 Tax=Roseococcus thiosulfatophilus TaxID=35813 RepID=UPI001A8E48FF|nr:YMGG-like glycine zipper-containing protein [Roseococcus thiosulfatophilus]
MRRLALPLALAAALAAGGCTNPNDPGQRAAGGGLIGAGAGALLGGMIGGGRGAAIGAITGGAVGVATGVVTTPQAPPPPYYGRPEPELK